MSKRPYEVCDCGKLLTVLDYDREIDKDGVAIVCVREDVINTASGNKCAECVESRKYLRDGNRKNPEFDEVCARRIGGVF